MRIVGGAWRGLALAGLGKGDPAAHLRPTSDRVRESLFSTLEHGGCGDPVPGARVLDLFAGTGALGLEALSRGAVWCDFVEQGRPAQRLISENIARTSASGMTRLIRMDATRLYPAPNAPASLVFLDPPYGKAMGEEALKSAVENGWIVEDTLIVWEEAQPMAPPPGFTLSDSRKYGGTHFTFLRRSA